MNNSLRLAVEKILRLDASFIEKLAPAERQLCQTIKHLRVGVKE